MIQQFQEINFYLNNIIEVTHAEEEAIKPYQAR
jgi:hypothetical protein